MIKLKSVLFAAMTLTASPLVVAEMVNINEADAATLAENLQGIGEMKAKSIVNYREENGNFEAIEDLVKVKGIGEALLEKNREDLSVKKGLTRTAVKSQALTEDKTGMEQTGKSEK